MGVHFDWQVDEEADQEPDDRGPRRSSGRWWRWGLAGMAAAGLVLAGFWGWGEWRIRQARQAEQERLQAVLDRQVSALEAGDGDAFWIDTPANPAWRAEQLKPANLAFWRGRPRVTGLERVEGEVWANVTWTDLVGIPRQRVVFFEEREGQLLLLDQSRRFWGDARQYREPWGTLRITTADLLWREEITRRVAVLLDEICAGQDCPQLTVAISDREFMSANFTQIVMLSPRIWGLTAEGEPDPRYWDALETRVRSQLVVAPIVFAVPAAQLRVYQDLVDVYEIIFAGRSVDLVALENLPADPQVILARVDGAAFTPSRELIAAGLVFDLTDLIATDPTFDQEDYYEQLWIAGRWLDRMWFMPQTARMSLVYFDRPAFRSLEVPAPAAGWTWEDLWETAYLSTESDAFSWGLVTIEPDLLYSLAYNAGNSCDEQVTVFCSPNLRPQDVTAAYETYLAHAALIPDTSGLTRREKLNYFQTQISVSTRKSPLWIDEPLMYEQHFLSRAAGVAAYPGSDGFSGVTPLYVQGNMISGTTDRPQAVWHWLKFLSYQYIERTSRGIPARPTVATAQRYWETLPRELGQTMREAFPFSRPVLLAEQGYFSDEVVGRVVSGELTPAAAGQIRPPLRWFAAPEA